MRFKFTLIIIFFSFVVQGQKEIFKAYAGEEGLDASFIYDIFQDEQGRLIYASEKGVFSFNGYVAAKLNIPNQSDRTFFTELYRSQFNTKWIGNNKGQIWNSQDLLDFQQIPVPEVFNSQIISFHNLKQDEMLAFSKSSGAIKINGDKISHLKIQDQIPLINCSIKLDKNKFLLGSNQGVFMLTLQSKFTELKLEPILEEIKLKVNCITKKDDQIWLGTTEGVLNLAYIDGAIRFIQQKKGLVHFNCSDILLLENKTLWVSSFNQGLAKLKNEKIEFFNEDNGLLSNKFNCLFNDNHQNIWLGSISNGLFRKVNVPFYQNQGSKYFGLDLLELEKIDGTSIYLNAEEIKSSNDLIDGESAQTIAREGKELIFASSLGSLKSYKNNRIKTILIDSHSFSNVNHILADDSNIYLSTSTNGFIELNRETNQLKKYNTQNGLTHNEVSWSFKDSKGKIWLSMSGAVLNSLQEDSIHVYDSSFGLHPFDFTQVTEDQDGIIWISSDGGGIYSYDNGKFQNFTEKEGLHSNYINSIMVDKEGLLWCSGGQNISIFNPKQLIFRTLKTKTDHYDFVINKNGIKMINDSIHLLTNKGLFHYNQDNDIADKEISPLFFNRISINDSIYSSSEKIVLDYGKYSLLAEYQKTSFENQNEIKYRYFLDGQEDSYGPAFADPFCYYPGLIPGNQILKVISVDEYGNANNEPLELEIFIDKPFYLKGWFYLACLVFLIGAFIVYTIIREKRNQRIQNYLNTELDSRTAEVKAQRNQLIAKNKEIEDSILYAETIQKAMLPNKKWITKNCKDYFIFYEPRDIVSGDFYWFTELENHFLFAGADCTGHGVPGSMTSMICISELNKSVQIKQLTDPGKILSDVDQGVKKALQHNIDSSSMDGMDIGLCVLNKNDNSICFAGAGRPLYIVQDEELQEIRGSRNHIGGDGDDIKDFEVHRFQAKKGTKIYLSSDGYVDQFGGPKGKKFMRKQFRELITSNFKTPLNKQEALFRNQLKNWRGDLDQIDDVLVLGIEF